MRHKRQTTGNNFSNTSAAKQNQPSADCEKSTHLQKIKTVVVKSVSSWNMVFQGIYFNEKSALNFQSQMILIPFEHEF